MARSRRDRKASGDDRCWCHHRLGCRGDPRRGPLHHLAGIPAVPLRPRFAPAVADRMQALAWWDWDHTRLRHALPDFRVLPAEAFLEKYEAA